MTTAGDAARTAARGVGQLLITAGVVILAFVAYELWFTGFYTQQQQHQLSTQLHQAWSRPPLQKPAAQGVPAPAVNPGQGIAILRIPALGRNYSYVIVEGVGTEALKKGPGHYPGTAMPGQVGNFVVSGHRTTYLAPFNRLDELHRGDPIVIETRNTWFVYDVTTTEVVDPSDVAVIAPVPDHPGATPTKAMLTFTTCNPKYSAAQRLIVHGQLAATRPKSDGPPPVLAAGKD